MPLPGRSCPYRFASCSAASDVAHTTYHRRWSKCQSGTYRRRHKNSTNGLQSASVKDSVSEHRAGSFAHQSIAKTHPN